jgi:hypothetical protein
MTTSGAPDVESGGSQIPDDPARAAPGAIWPVELGHVAPVIPVGLPPAVEMPVLWKSQPDFHRTLEISPRPRDSHISTADRHLAREKKDTNSAHAPRAPTEALDRR